MEKMNLIIVVVIAFLAILALIAIIRKQKAKAKAKRCAKESLVFLEKLKQLSDPSHFFTDEEAKQLKHEFAPLLREVHHLYNSMYLSHDYLDNLGLRRLIEQRNLLNHIQLENNRQYKAKH